MKIDVSVKKQLTLSVFIVGLAILLLLTQFPHQRIRPFSKPFSKLERSDIMEVSVVFGGFPAYPLAQEDLAPLAEALRAVELYEEDDYYGYVGSAFLSFQMDLSSGESYYITPANPFFIIDGVGYRTEYQPCETLSNIGYSYIDRIHDANPELSQPRPPGWLLGDG